MKQLYIKQKVFSLSEKFTVKDEQQQDRYFVEGSFLKIPKTFSILDAGNQEVGVITKKTFSFLPTFLWKWTGKMRSRLRKNLLFKASLRHRGGRHRCARELVGNDF